MEFNFQKTLLFLVFIAIGLLLKTKIKRKEELGGIKMIILNLALPATIFIALLSIEVKVSLLILPLLAIGLNLILFFAAPFIFKFLGLKKGAANYRTAQLLLPSLAPGLSCFPFILEFLGEAYLAKAAMADLGNKIFVLLILYLIAMRWFYKTQEITDTSKGSKFKGLCIAMISEPVNLFIGAALILLTLGFTMTTLPYLVSESLSKLSLLMTPLVLLFIGLSVNVKKKQFFQILSLLLVRAGFVAFLAVGITYFASIQLPQDRLLLLAFGLSACSFWPFAHIAAVSAQEKRLNSMQKTFNQDYAINILAISFPLSVILILGILSAGNKFADNYSMLSLAIGLTVSGFIYPLWTLLNKKKTIPKQELEVEREKQYQLKHISER